MPASVDRAPVLLHRHDPRAAATRPSKRLLLLRRSWAARTWPGTCPWTAAGPGSPPGAAAAPSALAPAAPAAAKRPAAPTECPPCVLHVVIVGI
jgi:hypothetical protein